MHGFLIHVHCSFLSHLLSLAITSVKPRVHTIRFTRPCVTCVYRKCRTSTVVCDKLQNAYTHKSNVHTIRLMRPCVTCVYRKSRISVVVCDKSQKKTHRMHQIGLLSTFLCDSYIVKKFQLFYSTRDNKLHSIVNAFDKYVSLIKFITDLRGK